MSDSDSLKVLTARSLKWNVIDRVASQVLYAVTGIVLARLLSQEDFGLVGAVLVFQAFASLLVDSGFSSALIQRKQPTETDYSTVLWFNLGVSVFLYVILYAAAPLIADCFQGDQRLIPLSRVMFLTFILNASSIVQVNRLMKRMDVKMVAVSNTLGLILGAVVGIWLAVAGYGAWAIVWQSIALSGTKSLVLWLTQHWRPMWSFSFSSLRSFFSIGSSMMFTSFLNTLFLNIYSFFIGNRVGMASLGYYTQSDKWSKMGIMSLSQVITSTFVPALSSIQDDRDRFTRVSAKMNRFMSYIAFPAFCGLIVLAEPIFHTLFGTKWDPSIILFQILLLRGIFTVIIGYYNNVLLALGRARAIMWMEIFRDSVALITLILTLPYLAEVRAGNIVYGLEVLLYGQLAASVLTWLVTLFVLARYTERSATGYILDMLPYAIISIVACAAARFAGSIVSTPIIVLIVEAVIGIGVYLAIGYATGSKIQKEVLAYVASNLRKK